MLYGFAKLNGAQFTVLDSELTRPLGEVSGFWLTWYYFGYSTAYGTLIALTQILGGCLLVMPRTSLASALCLLPVFANIVLIDIFFRIDLGAMLVAAAVLVILIIVIAPHATRLRDAVLLDSKARASMLRVPALVVIAALAWAVTWWAANDNNRRPTAIDGIWTVVSQPDSNATPHWREVYFERNRAFWVTFRTADGRDERHHFEMDQDGIVRVWQTWLTKGELLMKGTLTPDGRLDLEMVKGPGGHLWLTRKSRPADGTIRE
jgi:hypothetical protein